MSSLPTTVWLMKLTVAQIVCQDIAQYVQIIVCKPAMIDALTAPETGNVTTQARTMFLKIDQSTFSLDRNRPTNTTEPTLQ